MIAPTVSVEDHDEFRRGIDRVDAVRRHRRELGCFAGVHDRSPFAEGELEAAHEDEQPVMTRMDAWLGAFGGWLESHLDGGGATCRAAEGPDGHAGPGGWSGPDDDVVVLMHADEGIHVDLECVGESDQNIEADRSFAGLDAADRGCAEVAALGQVVEGPAQCPAQASEPGANGAFDILGSSDAEILADPCGFRKSSCPNRM